MVTFENREKNDVFKTLARNAYESLITFKSLYLYYLEASSGTESLFGELIDYIKRTNS